MVDEYKQILKNKMEKTYTAKELLDLLVSDRRYCVYFSALVNEDSCANARANKGDFMNFLRERPTDVLRFVVIEDFNVYVG